MAYGSNYFAMNNNYYYDNVIIATESIMRSSAIMLFLLFLLCVVVEVHSQTYPFVRHGRNGPALSNHSYVNLTAVGTSISDRVECHTDLGTCCNTIYGYDRGDWFFPNETRLSFISSSASIVEWRYNMRVELHRRNNGVANGIYQCTIETNAVNNEDGRETVYVGLYASGGEIYNYYCSVCAVYI